MPRRQAVSILREFIFAALHAVRPSSNRRTVARTTLSGTHASHPRTAGTPQLCGSYGHAGIRANRPPLPPSCMPPGSSSDALRTSFWRRFPSGPYYRACSLTNNRWLLIAGRRLLKAGHERSPAVKRHVRPVSETAVMMIVPTLS